MNVLLLGIVGLALGFSLTVPPGPMNALIAARSVHSFRTGVATGLGAMSADAILGAAVYALRTQVNLGSGVRIVEGVGAILLMVLAYRILSKRSDPLGDPVRDSRAYSQALLVGVSNPLQITWWLTAGLAFAYVGGVPLFVGLFGAIAIWVAVFPGVLRRGIQRYAGLPRAITFVSVALLLAFAAYFAALAVGVAG